MSSLIRKKGYWKSYRKIKSNVNEHIRYIYQRNEVTDKFYNDSANSNEMHESELRDTPQQQVSNTVVEQHSIQHQNDTSTEPEAIIIENLYNLDSDMSDTASVSSHTSAFSEVSSEISVEDRFDEDIFHVVLSCVICDTPARAFVKGVKGHSGYHGCEKCVQRGIWNGKMTFPEVNAELRTDVAFNEMRDESHHTGPSPFSGLQIGLVSNFPLDYMHLVCLGVVKRLLMLWMRGPLEGSCRLSATNLRQISEKLLRIGKHLPREFLRKGRSLYETDRWKASEFRQFLLYTGPVVLIGILPRIKYQHFLKLFVGIFCLSSPLLFRAYNEYASEILKIFVQDFAELYGADQIVYNVHNLVHLASDGNTFGPIDQFSAFVFESFLGKIKRLVRQPNFPLQQVIRRLSESSYQFSAKTKISVFGIAKKPHENGPVERHFRQLSQFKEVHFQEAFYSVNEGDNGIFVGNKVCLIRNILSQDRDSEKYVVYEEFREHSNFFTVPLNSSDLRIFAVSNLTGALKTATFQDVCKCTLLPVDDKFVAIPLIHTQL